MKKGEKVVGFIPAPAGLCATFDDDGNIEVIPENRVISLVLIEARDADGDPYVYMDGFVEGSYESVRDIPHFVGFAWEKANPEKPKGSA